ncbi:HdeD family acid-resistance protein [Ochrobactrum quorumnocens]|uniref:HdeD family acid-resistance protein n=1 Tax=Ochrobactrum quorumnocens TaxID=271865 RepID=UPI003854E80E
MTSILSLQSLCELRIKSGSLHATNIKPGGSSLNFMIRLLFLLLGARALKPLWRVLMLAGIVWTLLGFLLLFDLSDGRLSVVLDTLALFLIIEGSVEIAAAVSLGLRRHWIDVIRGGSFLFAAFLVFNVPWDNNIGAAIVFGTAFLIDGLFRIASAHILRSVRWRMGVAAGLIEVCLALMILFAWPVPHLLTVPFCFALLLLTSGYGLIRLALPLRELPQGASITSLPLYAARNWQGGQVHPVASYGAIAESGSNLNVYVWTALGSIKDPERRLLIDRYVAAVDKKGVISTGHAALEMPPDLYVSHYPANDIDHSPDDFRALLSAGHENDVSGRFNKSLADEAAAWCMPDQKVVFRRFNAQALRAFWEVYSKNNTYNLTARNCSTTVIQALDAAIEGASDTGKPLRDLFRIISDPHFWLMRIVRGRAEAMTWTPGLVLDYARLLHQVVEHSDRRWRNRIFRAIQSRRQFARTNERSVTERAVSCANR